MGRDYSTDSSPHSIVRCRRSSENCDPDVYAVLVRTLSMQAAVSALHVKNSSVPPRRPADVDSESNVPGLPEPPDHQSGRLSPLLPSPHQSRPSLIRCGRSAPSSTRYSAPSERFRADLGQRPRFHFSRVLRLLEAGSWFQKHPTTLWTAATKLGSSSSADSSSDCTALW